MKDKTEKRTTELLLVLDVDASDLFEDESPDWHFCMERASFVHNDACEFMLYIGFEDEETFEDRLRDMLVYDECSEDLLELMRTARVRGATWILLHA